MLDPLISVIDIWRCAGVMIKRYADQADIEAAKRAYEFEAKVERDGQHVGGREIAMMEWGLIPFFSKDGVRTWNTFNARAEEVRTRNSYREAFKARRCIVPATGYIEFTGPKDDKVAHLFTRTDGKPIALGGLWDRWTSADKSERKETYTVVTTVPGAFVGHFHDRMPLVLELDDIDA